jgi:uncharacterized membrane protein YphA (DoxX/SURF4 family)
VIVLASLLLGAVFVVSGVAKVAAPNQWRAQSGELGVPGLIATALPFVELAVGAMLIAQLARSIAAIVAAVMLVAFTVLLVVRLAQGRRPPCACFGALTTKPIGWSNVVRNIVFLALAGVVVVG